ncbi:MAG: biopolymer transporter ExbD [Flavobacteriales bacterium]|nr:biopolymer transporter ExbD [Flavobacteriales bacterium]
MGRRLTQEINAGSMADIAFLLLIFFLVTTTIDSDYGLMTLLPPPEEPDQDKIEFKERDVFVVLVNSNDQLLVENELLEIGDLKEKAKEFIVNEKRLDNLPQWEDINVSFAKQMLANAPADKKKKWEKRLQAAELLGPYTITKQVISLQNDRGTSYGLYIAVRNELTAAYNELRDEMAREKFGMPFEALEEKSKTSQEFKDKVKAIKTVYTQKISEAEPKDVNQGQ